MAHPTGESESDVVRLDFNRRLMLQFCGSVVTSDAGLYCPLSKIAMNIHHQTSIWQDAEALYEQQAGRKRRSRVADAAKYILFGIFGTFVAIINPTLLVLLGMGMSRQDWNIALNGAEASLFAIVLSFFIIRRLLRFPLLRTYGYIALTLVSNFCVVAIALRFLRVDFSSP